MDLKEYAARAKSLVNNFLETKKDCYPQLSNDIITRLQKFATAGKGVRGGLVLAQHDFYEGTQQAQAEAAAIAVELFHSGILIIDDIIDCDKLRRGQATMHHQLQSLDSNATPSLKRGESFAMCVGLIATYMAHEVVAEVTNPQAQKVMSTYYVSTGFAEMQELLNDSNPTVNREDIIKIYQEKTGLYTVAMPSLIGAYIANAPADDLQYFESIGRNLGVLFQLKDDLLELEGTTEAIGKSVTSDIAMNNMTFPRLVLQERVTEDEQQRLHSIYGTEPSDEDMSFLKSLHQKYNTADTIQELEMEYTTKVKQTLEQMQRPNSHLLFLIAYNKQRTK